MESSVASILAAFLLPARKLCNERPAIQVPEQVGQLYAGNSPSEMVSKLRLHCGQIISVDRGGQFGELPILQLIGHAPHAIHRCH